MSMPISKVIMVFRSLLCYMLILNGLFAANAFGDEELWAVNGFVNSLQRSGNILYLGGDFSSVGLRTGSWIVMSATSGERVTDWPKVTGTVYAIAPDGSDGWFIGGSFTHINGVAHRNFAHILANKSVASCDEPDDIVRNIVVDGSTVYISGDFSQVGGSDHASIAAIDASSCTAKSWSLTPGGAVSSLLVSGSTLYVGGSMGLRAFHKNDGSDISSFTPLADGSVSAIATDGSSLFVGGAFNSIGGATRHHIAAINPATGTAISSFNPNADYNVSHLLYNSGTLFVAGSFSQIGGASRTRLAALDTTIGLAIPWNPAVNGQVMSMALAGSNLYVAGEFTSAGGSQRTNIAALDIDTAEATTWNTSVDSYATAIAAQNGNVALGGAFVSVNPVERHGLAALDVTTGEPTDFNPAASGGQVLSIGLDDLNSSILYVGGTFTHIGGQDRNRLAALDSSTGEALDWSPNPNAQVRVIKVIGDVVLAGGDFTTISGSNRSYLAAVLKSDGNSLKGWTQGNPWNFQLDYPVDAIYSDGGADLYVGGSFRHICGQARNNLAKVDLWTITAEDWNPNPNGEVFNINVLSGNVYVGGLFSSIGGQTRHYAAALNATTGLATTFAPEPNALVRAFLWRGATLYIGGGFTQVGSTSITGMAEVDTTGVLTDFAPGLNGDVHAFEQSGNTVYAAGGFQQAFGWPYQGLAIVSDTLASIEVPAPSGTAQDGQTLTANKGQWTGVPPISYSYDWYQCNATGFSCSVLSGASDSQYTLAAANVGHTLRAYVTAADINSSTSVFSAATAVVAPLCTQAPVLSGNASNGNTLSTTTGQWDSVTGLTYHYHWFRCNGSCQEISGNDQATYVVDGVADGNYRIAVKVGASKSGSAESLSDYSNQSEIVPSLATATPTVTPTRTATNTPTLTPTLSATATALPTNTSIPTATMTETPTSEPTEVPTEEPTAIATATATETPEVEPTETPEPTLTPKQAPDLKPLDITMPTTARRGNKPTIKFSVNNIGSAASKPCVAKLYLSQSSTLPMLKPVMLGTISIGRIASGKSLKISKSLMIPKAAKTISYYVGVVLDPSSVSGEKNYTNNWAASKKKIKIS